MFRGSRFVKKLVLTFAPFSYLTDAAIDNAVEEEEEEKSVSVGANRKYLILFFSKNEIISARILNGGLSTTTQSCG